MFKPGQSGNPKGSKPGSKRFSTILDEMLDKVAKDKSGNVVKDQDGDPLTYRMLLAAKTIRRAIDKGGHDTDVTLDRTEGKVPGRIAGPDGEPLKVYLADGGASPMDEV